MNLKRLTACVLIAAVLLGLLAGCNSGATQTETPDNSSANASNLSAIDQSVTESEAPEETAPAPTIAEICAGARAKDPAYDGLYEEYDYDYIRINGRLYAYRDEPLSSVEWTPDDVVNHFRYHRVDWTYGAPSQPGNDDCKCIWNADYSQVFVANLASNWLMIDGIRSRPLDETTYSMSPQSLVEAFQAKEWSGDVRRSHDFSTEVKVDGEYGILRYEYDAQDYSETDKAGIAFDGFNDAPWWETTKVDVPLLHIGGSSGANGDGSTYRFDWKYALVYVDVPMNQQNKLLAVRDAKRAAAALEEGKTLTTDSYDKYRNQAQRNDDGLYCVMTDGIYLWRAGVLRQYWNIPTNSETILDVADDLDFHYQGSNCVYSKGKVYQLLDDGTFKVEAKNVVSATGKYGGIATFSIDRCCGMLSFYSHLDSGATSYIAKDVVAADLSDPLLPLYTDKSGTTYVIDYPTTDALHHCMARVDSLTITPVGKTSFEFCHEAYVEYRYQSDLHKEYKTLADYIIAKSNGEVAAAEPVA